MSSHIERDSASSTRRREQIVPRLMGFARLAQGLARRFIGLARWLALSGLASAVLLDWLAARAWGLSLGWALGLGALLMLPGLVLGWTWYVLDEVGDLPRRISEWAGQAKTLASARPATDAPAASGGRLADLGGLGNFTLEITSLGMDATDLAGILGATLSLTHPIYLITLAIATVLVAVLSFLAAIATLIALF